MQKEEREKRKGGREVRKREGRKRGREAGRKGGREEYNGEKLVWFSLP